MRPGAVVGAVLLVTATVPVATAVAQEPTRCDAAEELLKQKLTAEAKRQYTKALEDPAQRSCAINGLARVQKAEATAAAAAKNDAEAKKRNDKRLTGAEAWHALRDWFLGSAWPWFAAAAGIAGGVVLKRALLESNRVSIRMAKHHEELARRVVAAANAAGEGAAPAKLVVGTGDHLPGETVAGLTTLLRVPGTAPVTELLKLPQLLPRLERRVDIDSAVAGGWGVIHLTLRDWPHRKKSARLALPLGDIDANELQEVLALAGAAWLVAALQSRVGPGPVDPYESEALLAHAYFRAGANSHARGKVEVARACYAAMPHVDREAAPFAWAGARLNEMMELKIEKRWEEATRMADAIGTFPKDLIGSTAARHFSAEGLRDIRRRRRYLMAILRVDHLYALPKDQRPAERPAAKAAIDELRLELRDTTDTRHAATSLRLAMRMVILCFEVVDCTPTCPTLEQVRAKLLEEKVAGPRSPLGGAAFYDAACAVSLIMEKRKPDPPEEHVAQGLEYLRLALAASSEARRPHIRKSLRADPMLDTLEKAAGARFADAIGEEPKPAPPPPVRPGPDGRYASASVSGAGSGAST